MMGKLSAACTVDFVLLLSHPHPPGAYLRGVEPAAVPPNPDEPLSQTDGELVLPLYLPEGQESVGCSLHTGS